MHVPAPAAAEAAGDDVAVIDDFASSTDVQALRECALARRDRGDFRPARIGGGGRSSRLPEIRGDSSCWLAEPEFAAERKLFDDLERLRLALNSRWFLGLFDLELHYAWYPPGAGYERHVDRPSGRNERKVSMILYLNQSWQAEAGGELRLYETTGGHVDIAPIGGRLVHFLSAGREHAVLPTREDRWSLSGWFRARAVMRS